MLISVDRYFEHGVGQRFQHRGGYLNRLFLRHTPNSQPAEELDKPLMLTFSGSFFKLSESPFQLYQSAYAASALL